MAILHPATLVPTKLELVTAFLDAQEWGGTGEVEMIGGYRFDDPDGRVGVEALLVRRGDRVLQVPLTYRDAPLAGAEGDLVTTMTHSVLGDRWVHRAQADPVALGCFERALAGTQAQAELVAELPDGSREPRPQVVVVAHEGEDVADGPVRFTDDASRPVGGASRLVATWDGGSAVVASRG
ncbi:MAG: hypothetical protein ACI379_01690 [Nocardioides sp.]|uniref:maltokinase N-terminal cap-like domain-containing protein n=1 Tax=Nocardioides sp. TaxID=35761 RepID=UPI003F128835